MTNLFDYLMWRGDILIEQDGLKPMDLALLAELAHTPFEELKVGEYEGKTLLELENSVYLDDKPVGTWEWHKKLLKLWRMVPDCPRLSTLHLDDFTAEFDLKTEEQFAVCTFSFGKNAIVAFRGTDTSLNGWKENFNLGYSVPVPSQESALKYLDNLPDKYEKIWVTGHSKGGNLALYATLYSKNRDRIVHTFNFDGPGLFDTRASVDELKELEKRSTTYVPQSSVVGMIMGHLTESTYVKAEGIGLYQHDLFNWHLDGLKYAEIDRLSNLSVIFHKTLEEFMEISTNEERKLVVKAIFTYIDASGATTVDDLVPLLVKNFDKVFKAGNDFTTEEKEMLKKIRKTFLESTKGALNFKAISIKEDLTKKAKQRVKKNEKN